MSLFLADVPAIATRSDYALLHQLGCRTCPLAKVKGNKHPDMRPTGAVRPLIYFLGEAPGKEEDLKNEQFVGPSGQLLRARIPRRFRDAVRFNNVVRTRPYKNATPDQVSIECCRPSVIADIEQSKPRVIVGLGNVPLEWICGWTGIGAWRGRRMPVRIGQHKCWYYPIMHPAFILRQRRRTMDPDEIGSEDERIFVLDLKRVYSEIDALPEPIVHDAHEARRGTETIVGNGADDLDKVEQALRWAADLPVVGIDYETRGLRPYAADAMLLSIAISDGSRSVAFAMDHPSAGWRSQDKSRVRELWARFIREARGVKVAHNSSFELEWTGVQFGTDLVRAGRWACTQVQASIIDERSRGCRPGPLSLDFLTQQYFGFSIKDVFTLDRNDLHNTPLEIVLQYNAPDAKYAVLLWHEQGREIKRQGLESVHLLSQRRVPTVVLSQIKGIPISQPVVQELLKKYDDMIGPDDDWARGGDGWRKGSIGKQIAELDVVKQFERLYGRYNPMSNQHVLRIFHDMLGRKECEVIDKYTKRPSLSVDESVLVQIDHPLAQLTLKLRKAVKLRSTYIEPLKAGAPTIYPDGCLHVNYNTTFARTGRLSSDSINIQNIPKRSDEGREIRRAFVAPPGMVIVAADYGQIEARVIAMLTRDKRFCRALWERYDVHLEWAKRLAYACPELVGGKKFINDDEVIRKLREETKGKWTFALFFGASRKSVAGYFGLQESAIARLYDEFWREFDGVRSWQEDLQRRYRELGYVECATGRRRHGPLSYNEVINTPVQGTAADIVLEGMSQMSETGDPDLQPEINVHDDLTFMRVPKSRLDDVLEKIISHMLNIRFDFINVPISVEVSLGRNWMEMQKIGTYSSDEWRR